MCCVRVFPKKLIYIVFDDEAANLRVTFNKEKSKLEVKPHPSCEEPFNSVPAPSKYFRTLLFAHGLKITVVFDLSVHCLQPGHTSMQLWRRRPQVHRRSKIQNTLLHLISKCIVRGVSADA